ncbi:MULTISPECIES: hypothetical protein [Staphylococcus]|uniref:Phage protein n=1 Tax=Staphylococcus pasteuri_A TaxID=3062664 RepID=A0AAW7YPH4_9STAP|nr:MULTISPECIES: hypothetical protein [Staphylococcus]ATH63200.1 hypothetical protein BJG87_09540 [Staphylococcus pasteuri]MCF7600850.1 hypothetical protein [Staphylococcus pasteuri]MDO6573009.1 hypothetical protein [Staphylococcus pasteuri_A]MEB6208126.1 hypothetical protein [Staphylococcus pasteuri]
MPVTLSQESYDAMLEDIKTLRERIGEAEKKAKAWDNYCKSVEEDLKKEFGKGSKKVDVGMELNNNIFMEREE